MTGFEEEVKEGVKVAPAQGPSVSQRLGRGALKETGNPGGTCFRGRIRPHRLTQTPGTQRAGRSLHRTEPWSLHCDPHRQTEAHLVSSVPFYACAYSKSYAIISFLAFYAVRSLDVVA